MSTENPYSPPQSKISELSPKPPPSWWIRMLDLIVGMIWIILGVLIAFYAFRQILVSSSVLFYLISGGIVGGLSYWLGKWVGSGLLLWLGIWLVKRGRKLVS